MVGIASSVVIASGALGDDFHQQMMDQMQVQEGYDEEVLVNSVFSCSCILSPDPWGKNGKT